MSFPDIFSDIAVNWQINVIPDVKDGLTVSELMLASLHNNGKKRRLLEDILSRNQPIKFPIIEVKMKICYWGSGPISISTFRQ